MAGGDQRRVGAQQQFLHGQVVSAGGDSEVGLAERRGTGRAERKSDVEVQMRRLIGPRGNRMDVDVEYFPRDRFDSIKPGFLARLPNRHSEDIVVAVGVPAELQLFDMRRSSTGRSTLSIRSIWRCLLRACLMFRGSGTQLAQSLNRRIASSRLSMMRAPSVPYLLSFSFMLAPSALSPASPGKHIQPA